MRKLILVCLVGLLAGCGSSGLSPWAQSDQDTFNAGCVSTATSGSATHAQAVTYCQCVLDVVMSRYSAADYNANAVADSTAVANDGSTISTCRSKAGVN